MNIASHVLERAQSEPDAPAIHFPVGRAPDGTTRFETATNRDLDLESDAIAHALQQIGVMRGVRTALMVRPSLDLFVLMLALFKTGAIPVLIDPGIGLRRLRRCLNEAEPEAFIGIPQAQAARIALRWARASVRIVVTVGRRFGWGGTTLAALREAGSSHGKTPYPVASTRDDDDAAILYTSGSTGPPKGVIYRHSNFAAQVEAIRDLGQIEPGEIDLPTFAPFALFDPALGMASLIPEMDPTRPGSVDPQRILQPAEHFGATNLFGSPALLETVGRYGVLHGVKLSTLRRVVSAGAPVSAETMARFLELLPDDAEIHTPYGATECLPVSCISSTEVLGETAALTNAGAGVCVGAPVPSIEVRILAIVDGQIERWDPALELGVGEIGEIVVRGPQATAAYLNLPEATALAKISDPDVPERFWHRMGDTGYLDARGRLWYCGRKADRVERAGETLHSIPVEAVFDTHENVRRTALVGVAGIAETVPVLCVELLDHVPSRGSLTITDELRAIGARFPHTRCISHVLFHPGFPVDIRHNAKIGRPELARWATRQLRGRLDRPTAGPS